MDLELSNLAKGKVVLKPICGDGLLRGNERCDTMGDAPGCVGCQVEFGYTCVGEPSDCRPTCGDGIVLNIGAPLLGAPVGTTADANGNSVVSGPTTPAFAGTSLLFQYFGMDGTGGNTWASSNRLRLTF